MFLPLCFDTVFTDEYHQGRRVAAIGLVPEEKSDIRWSSLQNPDFERDWMYREIVWDQTAAVYWSGIERGVLYGLPMNPFQSPRLEYWKNFRVSFRMRLPTIDTLEKDLVLSEWRVVCLE